jgi:hypothetical protein
MTENVLYSTNITAGIEIIAGYSIIPKKSKHLRSWTKAFKKLGINGFEDSYYHWPVRWMQCIFMKESPYNSQIKKSPNSIHLQYEVDCSNDIVHSFVFYARDIDEYQKDLLKNYYRPTDDAYGHLKTKRINEQIYIFKIDCEKHLELALMAREEIFKYCLREPKTVHSELPIVSFVI